MTIYCKTISRIIYYRQRSLCRSGWPRSVRCCSFFAGTPRPVRRKERGYFHCGRGCTITTTTVTAGRNTWWYPRCMDGTSYCSRVQYKGHVIADGYRFESGKENRTFFQVFIRLKIFRSRLNASEKLEWNNVFGFRDAVRDLLISTLLQVTWKTIVRLHTHSRAYIKVTHNTVIHLIHSIIYSMTYSSSV